MFNKPKNEEPFLRSGHSTVLSNVFGWWLQLSMCIVGYMHAGTVQRLSLSTPIFGGYGIQP